MKKARRNNLTYSSFEPRRLLAGDVNVFVSDNTLFAIGDNLANQIEVTRNETGVIVVSGRNTSINGSNSPFVAIPNVLSVDISLDGGDDEATLSNVIVLKDLNFKGGDGDDRFQTVDSYAGQFHADSGIGNDVFELGLITAKAVDVHLGGGDDVLAANNLFVGKKFQVFGSDDNETVTSDTLIVNRGLSYYLDGGNDQVLFAGETSTRRSTHIDLGAGDDFLGVLPSQNAANAFFRTYVAVHGGDGSDNVAFDNDTRLIKNSYLDGGDGVDAIEESNAIADDDTRIKNFENRTLTDLPGNLDSIFDRLLNAGVDPTRFGGMADSPVVLSVTDSTLNFTENDDPINIDSGLSISGPDSQLISQARVRINSFQSGQEALFFDNNSNITGSFNSTNGVLSLTGNASLIAYQQALRNVTYQNTSEDPLTNQRSFGFTLRTNQGNVSNSRNFSVISVNDAPDIELTNTSLTTQFANLPVTIDSQLTVTDADDNQLDSAVVTITTGFNSGQDVLTFDNVQGINGTFDSSTGALTFTGDVDLTAWQAVLRSVAFANDADTQTNGTRLIRFTVNDGQATDFAEFELTVTGATTPANRFMVAETARDGTVLGRVQTETQFGTPIIYEFADSNLNSNLLLNPDEHLSGNLAAPVQLTEYLDFQCPACAAIHPTVQQLKSDFADDLLVVTRHLPLESVHLNARAAARASEAAHRQDMFDEMADLLFENQAEWEFVADPTSFFEDYANQLSLDLTQFRNDVLNADIDLGIQQDADAAASLGATGTPTFFLNNELIALPNNATEFETLIQQAVDAIDQAFSINRETGDIVLVDSSLLDSSVNPVVTIPILVEDAAGNTEVIDVVIDITN